jgi:hypothetical protein
MGAWIDPFRRASSTYSDFAFPPFVIFNSRLLWQARHSCDDWLDAAGEKAMNMLRRL